MAFIKISLVLLLCLLGYSQFGYCGTNDAYCGAGCRSDRCRGTGTPISCGSVSSIVTQQFFNNIIQKAGSGCAGKRFFTRDSFINAANTFSNFGKTVTRREIATMFAHFTHDTAHFCYIGQRNGKSRDDCFESVRQEPCEPGRGYFGGRPSPNLDLQRQAELVDSNATVGFKTSLSFWIYSVRPVMDNGFGATIRAIGGMDECNGRNSSAVNERIRYYRDYCGQLGVDPGSNLSC